MRIFFDTNVYIVGAAYPDSPEAETLRWVGWGQKKRSTVDVVVSQELFDQISRVARRLKNKDWSGEIIGRVWHDLRLVYVLIDEQERSRLETSKTIPREDVGIYLTAREGAADIFVSSNHELIQMLAKKTGEFECLTPEGFIDKLHLTDF